MDRLLTVWRFGFLTKTSATPASVAASANQVSA